MKSKFSPKFTIVTHYPMMFSAEDLKCVELEIIDTLIEDETASFKHLPPTSDGNLPNDLIAFAGFSSLAKEEESRWLQQTKQQLEALWEIEINTDQDKGTPWSSAVDPIFPGD